MGKPETKPDELTETKNQLIESKVRITTLEKMVKILVKTNAKLEIRLRKEGLMD